MADERLAPEVGHFDTYAIADSFPEEATTLLLDQYLTDGDHASARVFRVYRSSPPHYHANSDEHLFVLRGRGTFWMGDSSAKTEFGPGHLLVFKRNTVHAMPDILQSPVVFLAIDSPRRDPKDVIFENPADGTPESFVQARSSEQSR